jgi:hypothetical protein
VAVGQLKGGPVRVRRSERMVQPSGTKALRIEERHWRPCALRGMGAFFFVFFFFCFFF